MPVMDGGGADRVKEVAQLMASHQAERDRCVVGSEGGGADLGDGAAQHLGRYAHAVDVAGLALVGAKTHGGVTLDMLDRFETLAHRQVDVAGADIVLEIDKLLRRAAGRFGVRHLPQGAQGAGCQRCGERCCHSGRGQSGGSGRGQAGRGSLLRAIGQVHGLAAAARRALGLHRRARYKTGQLVIPDHFAAGLAMEVDHRAEAARDCQQVTGQGGRATFELALAIHPVNLYAADGPSAACFHHHLASQNRQAQAARPFTERAIGHGSGVHHRHRRTGLVQSQCRVVGAVVVGENHRLPTRQHGVTPDIGRDGRGQHHTRQVVVGKDQGTLMGASGQHHLFGPHLPQALAHRCHTAFKVVATALGQRQKVVVLVAEHRGAAEHHHLGHRLQPAQGVFGPGGSRQIVHHGIAGQQPTPWFGLFVSKNHTRTRSTGRQRCTQASQPAAGHQHIAKSKSLVVVVGVSLARRLTQAAGFADVVLKEVPGLL